MTESKTEDLWLRNSTLEVEGGQLAGIPCKVFLPDRTTDRPHLLFHPTREQLEWLSQGNEFAFSGVLRDHRGDIQTEVSASQVFMEGAESRYWGEDGSRTELNAAPADLVVVHRHSESRRTGTTHLTFWLSPNTRLIMRPGVNLSFLGDVQIRRSPQTRYELSDALEVGFSYHYQASSDDNELRQWSFLVAESEVDSDAREVPYVLDQLLDPLDDFLLLASLGTAERVICCGWQASDNTCLARYFRSDRTVPTVGPRPSLRGVDGLIRQIDLEEFLSSTYDRFRSAPSTAVRSAIYSLHPTACRSAEDNFLSLFSALEELLLEYRRSTQFIQIFDDGDFRKLRSHLAAEIKRVPNLATTKEQRALLYAKLGELNHVPIGIAFTKFVESLEVDLSDLWPAFENDQGPSLYLVRNRLVHGDALPMEEYEALWVATEHLKWTLERILLSILGWPIEGTEVSPATLDRCARAMALKAPSLDTILGRRR